MIIPRILDIGVLCETFVKWLKIIYTDIESALDLNNILTDFFFQLSAQYDKDAL